MKKILLFCALLGLVAGCAGHREMGRYDGSESDIRPVIQLGHSDAVQAVAISPDDRFAVSGSADGTLKFWDIATGRVIYTSYHHLNRSAINAERGGYRGVALLPQVTCVEISATGALLLSGASDGNVIVTEIRTGAIIRVYPGHRKSVNAVSFSNDAKLAVTGDADGEIRLWQITTGRTIGKFDIKFRSSQITALDLSPDGRMILAGDSDGMVRLIDPAAEHPIQLLGHHTSRVSNVKFSPDGNLVVAGSWDGSIKLWGMHPRRELKFLSGHKKKVVAVEFNRNSDRILSCASDGTVNLWNTASNLLSTTRINHQADVYAAAFSDDERFLITGSRDRTLKRSWISTGRTINSFEGRASRIHSVVFSPDGRLLLSSMRGQVNCWDMTTGRLRRIFKATLYDEDPENRFKDRHVLSMYPNSIGFSPDGQLVVSLGSDGTYRTWKLATGRQIKTTERHATKLSTVAYSPDKRYYARGTRVIHVRDTTDDRIVRTLDGHKRRITAIAYSPDGRSILSGDEGGNLILWNVTLGHVAKKIQGHPAAITSIDFSAAGRFAASGSWDNTCRVWDIARGQEIVKLIASRDGEWITSTPDGFYINSPEGNNLIHWSVPGELETYSFEQFESKFRHPDILAQRLSWNRDINLIAPDISKPPRIDIEGQDETISLAGDGSRN